MKLNLQSIEPNTLVLLKSGETSLILEVHCSSDQTVSFIMRDDNSYCGSSFLYTYDYEGTYIPDDEEIDDLSEKYNIIGVIGAENTKNRYNSSYGFKEFVASN